jgi:4-diphosphocytidyl-2-C-methyl-D-erythritol kinase
MRVLAYAKINLTLEVLNRRPDGFHNLRTVFQTVSISDVLDFEVGRSRTTRISVVSNVEIPGENLITRAAHAVLEAMGVRARILCQLQKRVPMGAGMGGGSANAAAVLRALPDLLQVRMDRDRLIGIAASLGSDVPYFLLGGTALGLGRGTELYPLPDLPAAPVLILATGLHVSTAEAYSRLGRTEFSKRAMNLTERFAQSIPAGEWHRQCGNDFETSVFAVHPELASLRRKLERAGALAARMTGSGSALFGVFASRPDRDAAASRFRDQQVFKATFLPRRKLRMLTSDLSRLKGA